MRRTIMFAVAAAVSLGATLALAAGDAGVDGGAKASTTCSETDAKALDARVKELESRDRWANVAGIAVVSVFACGFLFLRSFHEKTTREAEAKVSAAAVLTKVLAASLEKQAPKSLEEAVTKATSDLAKLETDLKDTTAKVETVIDLMTKKP